MKKFLTIVAALALVLGLSQCKKTRPDMPQYSGSVGDMYIQHVKIDASHGSSNSKVDGGQDGNELKFTWQTGDEIYVYNQTKKQLQTNTLKLKGEPGNAEGHFEGDVIGTDGDRLTFYYKGVNAVVNCNDGVVTYDASNFNGQDGTLKGDNGILKRLLIMKKDVTFPLDGSTLELSVPYAILKLDLSSFGATDKANDDVVVTITKGVNPSAIATVTGVTTVSKEMYVVLPADNTKQTYTLDDGNRKTVTYIWTLDGNKFFTADGSGGAIEPFTATVVTIPVCAIHANCASSGGVVTGTGVAEQGVCWGTSANPTIDGCHYVHQYEYSTGKLTPKNETKNNTFTGFMSGLSANTKYYVRAYIRKGSQVKYGDDIEFTTLASEPEIQYVDLGLSVKWATCNLGAANEYDCGDYYQWGDLAACNGTTLNEAVYCAFQSYRFAANNNGKQFTKYCSGNADYWYTPAGTPDNKFQLDLTDDCVRQTLGDGWRMPTQAEWEELCDVNNTTRTWTTSGGVSGWRFTSKKAGYTDKSIFLPAAGCRLMAKIQDVGTKGNYWSSSLYTDVTGVPPFGIFSAYDTYFDSGNLKSANKYSRHGGFSVRPVK